MENVIGTLAVQNQTSISSESPTASPLSFFKRTEERKRERRLLGKPTPSLKAQLRACNILQLKAVKKLCDQLSKITRRLQLKGFAESLLPRQCFFQYH
jgi:hypothetical protein